MELYHRGFLDEQKLFLEQTKPRADAANEEWDEFNSLVKQYEENCENYCTQLDLAGDLCAFTAPEISCAAAHEFPIITSKV